MAYDYLIPLHDFCSFLSELNLSSPLAVLGIKSEWFPGQTVIKKCANFSNLRELLKIDWFKRD